ncbi:MAG: class B sortase [Bacillota bacterium]|nr:class B sortase [Bacillota bacterium]
MRRLKDHRYNRSQRMKMRKARRGRAKMPLAAKALAVLSGALAITAIVLLINYLVSWGRMNKEQEAMRALYKQETRKPPEATPESALQIKTTPFPEEPETARLETVTPENTEQTAQAQALPPAETEERASMADRFVPLMRHNQDVVGWLTYPMFSEMDFAVVQRDNYYYMDRAFSGERNIAGTVFMDESNQIRPRDKNLILHGHNMKNGTMFGRLARMMEPAVIKAEPFMSFDTLYQDSLYVPYAVTVFSVDPQNPQYYNIVTPNFETPEEMGEYVNWLRARSVLRFPVEISANDKLLTLVTCHGLDEDERLAVALRAVRPGESTEAIKQAIKQDLVKN